jgi:hypothetical protein
MTNRTLKKIFVAAICFYACALLVGLTLKLCGYEYGYQIFKDLNPLLIAIPAAYLTYSLQRRLSYLQALRDFWKILIPAVQAAVQYTHLDGPDKNEFSIVARDLSTVVDAARGVFHNIPLKNNKIGLYPYEPLKDIYSVLSWVREGRSPHERHLARRCILQLWYDVHSALLLEFDLEVPSRPVSKYMDSKSSVSDKLFSGTLAEQTDFRT